MASSNPPGSLQLTVADSLIRGNRFIGIQIEGAVNAAITNSIFQRNREGAIQAVGGTLTVSGCTFERNKSQASRGSIIVGYSNGASTAEIRDSTFVRNPAGGVFGGGIYTVGGGGALTMTMSNLVLRGNGENPVGPGGYGVGGIKFFGGPGSIGHATIRNCTVFRNRGSGLVVTTGGNTTSITLSNNLLWENHVDLQYSENTVGSLTVNADHNDIGVQLGNATFNDLGGNISADPLLASRTDVHLTATSPAIDTGTCTGAPATDFEGDPRPTGAGCDMGADEFVP